MADVELKREGHLLHVRLNRPKSLNAINGEMDDALFAAWQEIDSDPEIWAGLLSAEGEKAFCVGADVRGGASKSPRRMALGGGLTGVGGPLVQLRKPLIAAVQGYVLGGGFELAMCADVIVAASGTQFGIPETAAGIMGESGIMHRAIRQLPYRIALSMVLTGERLGAAEARQYGLINEVVEFSGLMQAANRWAEKLMAAAPLAAQAAKQAVLQRAGWPLDVALATRFEPIEAYAFSEDRIEGQNAFAQKRKPSWTGR